MLFCKVYHVILVFSGTLPLSSILLHVLWIVHFVDKINQYYLFIRNSQFYFVNVHVLLAEWLVLWTSMQSKPGSNPGLNSWLVWIREHWRSHVLRVIFRHVQRSWIYEINRVMQSLQKFISSKVDICFSNDVTLCVSK